VPKVGGSRSDEAILYGGIATFEKNNELTIITIATARFARVKGKIWFIFRLRPKNEPPLLLFASEASKKYPKTG
jgi:hypothetical protein